MHIPWEWIKEKTRCGDSYSAGKFTEQLNYCGLECEQNFTDGILFINFVTAHNRKDLKSWWGLVREISILLDLKKITSFSSKSRKEHSWLATTIGNLQFTIRSKQVVEYNMLALHNFLKRKCLPTWILQSLTKNGVKSVNPVVDIANFTSLETGQPFHLFDLGKLQRLSAGKEVTIRDARGGELFIDLSKKERKLTAGSLLMETNGEVVELLGVIGGSNTAVDHTTKQILVESASFTASRLELTCNGLAIRTRASEVFTSSQNQENCKDALERFGEVFSEFYDYQENKTEYFSFPVDKEETVYSELEIETDFLAKRLGISVVEGKVEVILQRLGFSLEKGDNLYTVKIPKFRSDIRVKEDLLEEIGKLLDYNSLPGSLPTFQNQFIDLQFNNTYHLRRKIALYLMSNGYQEILSYSLTQDTRAEAENSILLTNPTSRTRTAYRTSFINSHLAVIRHNQGQGREDLFLFEMGNVYSRKSNPAPPVYEEILSVIATGKIVNSQLHQLSQQVDLYWMKGLFENLLALMDIEQFVTEKVEFTSSMDFDYPLLVAGEKVGFIRQFSAQTLRQNRVQNTPCFMLQLSLSKLFSLLDKQEERKYTPLSYLPIITKNISFVTAKSIPLGAIVEVIRDKGGEFLLEVSLVDIYEKVKSNHLYSLNFQLLFQGKNVNLQNSEVEAKIEKIWQALTGKFSVLRR